MITPRRLRNIGVAALVVLAFVTACAGDSFNSADAEPSIPATTYPPILSLNATPEQHKPSPDPCVLVTVADLTMVRGGSYSAESSMDDGSRHCVFDGSSGLVIVTTDTDDAASTVWQAHLQVNDNRQAVTDVGDEAFYTDSGSLIFRKGAVVVEITFLGELMVQRVMTDLLKLAKTAAQRIGSNE